MEVDTTTMTMMTVIMTKMTLAMNTSEYEEDRKKRGTAVAGDRGGASEERKFFQRWA